MNTSDHEAHGLTAGYVVHALSPAERERAERHLRECADCRRDLRDFQETTVRLAYGVAEPPGEEVWRDLRSAVAGIRQLPPEPGAEPVPETPVVRDLPRRHTARLPWLIAAASVLIVLVLGGVVVLREQQMSALQEHTATVDALLASSDTRMSESAVPGSEARATVFASDSYDMAMIVVKGLPFAPDDKCYQLWYIDADGAMRSAGILHPSKDGEMLSAMTPDLGGARQLGITMEPTGGMPQPSEEPMRVDV